MNLRHVFHVFRKDAVELLRDRRTLFVNVLLPVLIYPLGALFFLQVHQLVEAQKKELPRIAVVDVDAAAWFNRSAGDLAELRIDEPRQRALSAGALAKPETPRVELVVLDAAAAAELRARSAAAAAAQRAGDAAEPGPDGVAVRRAGDAARAALLAVLRRLHLAAAVVGEPTALRSAAEEPLRVVVVSDDAHPESLVMDAEIAAALALWRRDLQTRRLAAAGISPAVLRPLSSLPVDAAPVAESVRAKLAGVIPLLLVIMAASGAFFPALDLIAGERERGTLETLLSWPMGRREIFVGKLLVTCAAAVASVVLTLGSLGVTVALFGSRFAGGGGGEGMAVLLSIGGGTLALCFAALLPLTVCLAAVSLALAGLANSNKEAQNYLTPLILVVTMAAGVALLPGTRPNLALDLVPITGPVLALKESLRAGGVPWLHLLLSTAASVAVAVVVVGWAVRLLDSEAFCYPGLVRAGWGRFRRWGTSPPAPSGLEAMGVYAVAVGLFFAVSLALDPGQWQPSALRDIAAVAVPLVACLLLPALLHAWLGAYPLRSALGLARPPAVAWARAVFCIPFALITSVAIDALLRRLMENTGVELPRGLEDGLRQTFARLDAAGGMPLVLVCIAVLPGICEEVLCRGALLSGLRRSLGTTTAVLLSAFLFALLHGSPFRFVPQFTIGVALAILAVRSGSILPGMVLHAGHNALAVLLGDRHLPEIHPGLALGIGLIGLAAGIGLIGRRRLPSPAPAVDTRP